jgi:hypothetical protein
MDDEVYVADLDDSNGSISQDTNGTSSLWANLREEDFLPPFSVIIDIPNLYYGTRVTEGTVVITADISSGENIKLQDSNGSIYYGDPKQKAKVGIIDYINGIIVVYHPSLSSMGLGDWSIEFKGFKKLFVKQYDLQMNKGVGTVSNNPSFKQLKASANSHDKSDRITMVSNIYLHDNNLNVLAKASLASPIVKRSNDSFLFRLKLDF